MNLREAFLIESGDEEKDWDGYVPVKHRVPTVIPESHYDKYDVEDRHEFHLHAGRKPKLVTVKPEDHHKIAGIQDHVDKRFNPVTHRQDAWVPHPEGIRVNGKIHIKDGHHRVDWAMRHKEPVTISVFDHTDRHEKSFKKKMKARGMGYET